MQPDNSGEGPGWNDLFHKCRNFTRPDELKNQKVYPYFTVLEGTEGPVATHCGREMLNFGSNNYQGLTHDPRVVASSIAAVHRFGTSPTASRLLGTNSLHTELERKVADSLDKEDALIFPTGLAVNVGVISALVGPGEVVLTDSDNHASINLGCRLARGVMVRYRHNDLQSLESRLARQDRPALVVTDSVFSMSGDLAPLDRVTEICARHRATLMVDEAHGFGVYGGGRGWAAQQGVLDRVALVMITFSKSLASVGGAVAGPHDVIEYLKHHAAPFVFSAALPAGCTAAALTALEIVLNEPERLTRLFINAARLRLGLRALGFQTNDNGPIVSIYLGDEMQTFQAWRFCFEGGLLVNAVVPPAVPKGQSLLRSSVMVTHTPLQIDRALDVFHGLGRQLGLPRR